MYNMLAEPEATDIDYSVPKSSLKSLVIQQLNEQLLDDLNNMHKNIAIQALEHIHSNEIIMTMGKSKTVELFLKSAAKKRKFTVIVAETCPFYHGQETASTLAKEGIETILIPDSGIFAMMARVNKVILGTHAVTANGGLIAISGSHMMALAAKHHSTPVVVCTGLFKLSPLYPHDRDSFNLYVSPEKCLSYENGNSLKIQFSILQ